MRKRVIWNLSIHRSLALPAVLVLLMLTPKCDHPQPPQPPPDIGVEAGQALLLVLRQSEESQDFIARFKGKINNFSQSQVHLAQNKYGQTLTEVNAVVDELKKKAAGTSTLTEDEFKNKAKSAVDANVELNTLMERAVDNAIDFHNFVLRNANTLPDSWTTLWRASSSLSAQQKQQFASFLEDRIRYKPWEVIKKK